MYSAMPWTKYIAARSRNWRVMSEVMGDETKFYVQRDRPVRVLSQALDSEDDYRSGSRNVNYQQQSF